MNGLDVEWRSSCYNVAVVMIMIMVGVFVVFYYANHLINPMVQI
jgi:hypothetical protein